MSDARYTIQAPEARLYIASWGEVGSRVGFTPGDHGNVLIISPPLKKGSEVVGTIKGASNNQYISLRPAGPPVPGKGDLVWSDKPYEWKISDKTISTFLGSMTYSWSMQYDECWQIIINPYASTDFDIVKV
ncbi:hypothetical protein AX14_014425 [Amanita brunnescens Koide BX004]|nr:hypothetical protein AX14_014425 [Amanita brunnescens Koide BX004]